MKQTKKTVYMKLIWFQNADVTGIDALYVKECEISTWSVRKCIFSFGHGLKTTNCYVVVWIRSTHSFIRFCYFFKLSFSTFHMDMSIVLCNRMRRTKQSLFAYISNAEAVMLIHSNVLRQQQRERWINGKLRTILREPNSSLLHAFILLPNFWAHFI